jgi:tripartite-type tricarboxylate transporter receptor subunit TctC
MAETCHKLKTPVPTLRMGMGVAAQASAGLGTKPAKGSSTMIRVVAVLAALLGASTGVAHGAVDYPIRPVKVVVPFAPAGPVDFIARFVAQKLGERFDKPFYVENHPGAGGNIGMGLVAQSPPDGQTILFTSSTLVINPGLYDRVPYDVYNDLAPVTLAAVSPLVLVVHPSLQVGSIKQLVDHLKAEGNKSSIGSTGAGTTSHLVSETFKRAVGLDLVHVPFNGAGPALSAVLAGHVPLALLSPPTVEQHIAQGRLRGLAVTSEHRVPTLPGVPTMAEAGVPGDQVADVMLGVLVPGRTPREIVDRLHQEIVNVIAQPEAKQRLEALGFEVVANTPDEFAARIRLEVPKWAKVIREAGIKVE